MALNDSQGSLVGSIAGGAAWLASARILVRAIGLISTIILARLLLPEDFGLIALATALVFVLEALSDLRFEHAIIAQRDTTDTDLNTAWTLNLLRGVAIALIVCVAAYPYAQIMEDTRLTGLLLMLALVPLLDGLKNPAFITYEKEMIFHKEFLLQLSHKLMAFAVTITLAWLYRSYWALVAGIITGTATRVAVSYAMHPFRPRPELKSWQRLVSYSGWLMGSNLITAILKKVEFFFIGAFLPVRIVGLFHVGAEISSMASNEMVLPVKRALFPALSALANDPQRQYNSFCRAIEVVTAIALPLGVGLALVADPFVLLALGARWQETANVMHYLGPVASIWAIAGICDTLIMSCGNTRLIFSREIIKASYLIPGYALGVWMDGLQGFLNATVVIVALSLLLNLDMVRRQSSRPLLQPLHGTWRSLAASLLMTLSVIWVDGLFEGVGDAGRLSLHLLVLISIGCTSYLSAHLLLWIIVARPPGVERLLVDFIRVRWSHRVE